MDARFGIVITNRDRPRPLRNCLLSLAAQRRIPHWIVIADLGSGPDTSIRLQSLADEFQVSYLRIDSFGPWKQALAFNTALRRMPEASHVVQLDADMVLHPYLLEFSERVLRTRDALSCVTSYAPPDASWDSYDGSWAAYQELLCRSKAGIPAALGGYMVLPREWLLKNRGFDEAYVGWGFEDGDLWWRAQRGLNTYCEASGSLLIHQAHVRQPGASAADGNPNWEIHRRRKEGADYAVNPHSFGDAPVSKALIRLGVRPLSPDAWTAHAAYPWKRRAPLRRLRNGRLKPHYGPADPARCSLASELESLRQSGSYASPFRVSVLMTLHNHEVHLIRAAAASVFAQTVPAQEIVLSDQGSANSYSRSYHAFAQEAGRVKYVWSGSSRDWSRARAINEGLRVTSATSTHVLITDGELCFHPHLLEICRLSQGCGPCFVHGHSHWVPSIAGDFQLIEGLPWEAWGSVTYLDNVETDPWHFAPRSWCLQAGLYDERRGGTEVASEAVARARRDGSIRVLRLPPDWPVSFRGTSTRF
jgi:hypothetical protein